MDDIEQRFRAMADAFIDLANQQAEGEPAENVGMSMLYAASRFNAFVVAQKAGGLTAYQADLDQAKTFFEREYRNMLAENLDDYQRAFVETSGADDKSANPLESIAQTLKSS